MKDNQNYKGIFHFQKSVRVLKYTMEKWLEGESKYQCGLKKIKQQQVSLKTYHGYTFAYAVIRKFTSKWLLDRTFRLRAKHCHSK
jgi:hypothetical protein